MIMFIFILNRYIFLAFNVHIWTSDYNLRDSWHTEHPMGDGFDDLGTHIPSSITQN